MNGGDLHIFMELLPRALQTHIKQRAKEVSKKGTLVHIHVAKSKKKLKRNARVTVVC